MPKAKRRGCKVTRLLGTGNWKGQRPEKETSIILKASGGANAQAGTRGHIAGAPAGTLQGKESQNAKRKTTQRKCAHTAGIKTSTETTPLHTANASARPILTLSDTAASHHTSARSQWVRPRAKYTKHSTEQSHTPPRSSASDGRRAVGGQDSSERQAHHSTHDCCV
jgi:hypothetical protein